MVTHASCKSSHSMQSMQTVCMCVCPSRFVGFSRTLSPPVIFILPSFSLISAHYYPPVWSIWHHVEANFNKIFICHTVLDGDRQGLLIEIVTLRRFISHNKVNLQVSRTAINDISVNINSNSKVATNDCFVWPTIQNRWIKRIWRCQLELKEIIIYMIKYNFHNILTFC